MPIFFVSRNLLNSLVSSNRFLLKTIFYGLLSFVTTSSINRVNFIFFLSDLVAIYLFTGLIALTSISSAGSNRSGES